MPPFKYKAVEQINNPFVLGLVTPSLASEAALAADITVDLVSNEKF